MTFYKNSLDKLDLSKKYSQAHAQILKENRGLNQGWAENSTPGNLPVFPCMANKAQVAKNGKYNFFATKYWQIWLLAVKCSRYP